MIAERRSIETRRTQAVPEALTGCGPFAPRAHRLIEASPTALVAPALLEFVPDAIAAVKPRHQYRARGDPDPPPPRVPLCRPF